MPNSKIGDMGNVWSNYRRNMNVVGASVNARANVDKVHSLSRQEFLVQQQKLNQQMQFKMMQEKVSLYQAKLAGETVSQEHF
jgi:uncharacterized Fe-S cluster-containing protein